MDIQKIHQYKSAFDLIAKSIKDDEGNTIEVWYARKLQQVLGYARWEKFVVAIDCAMAQREVQDFMLTRYAWCFQR